MMSKTQSYKTSVTIFLCIHRLALDINDIKEFPFSSALFLSTPSHFPPPCSHRHLRLAVGGQSLVLGVHVRGVAIAQRLREELGQRLDAELPLVGVGLTPAVLLVQRLVLLLLDGVMLLPPDADVRRRRVLNVALAGVPGFKGRAGRERVGVGLGDLGFGDLGGVDGDGQRCVDIGRWEEGFVLWMEVDGLESGWRLAVSVIYHWVALVVVSCTCVWMIKTEKLATSMTHNKDAITHVFLCPII